MHLLSSVFHTDTLQINKSIPPVVNQLNDEISFVSALTNSMDNKENDAEYDMPDLAVIADKKKEDILHELAKLTQYLANMKDKENEEAARKREREEKKKTAKSKKIKRRKKAEIAAMTKLHESKARTASDYIRNSLFRGIKYYKPTGSSDGLPNQSVMKHLKLQEEEGEDSSQYKAHIDDLINKKINERRAAVVENLMKTYKGRRKEKVRMSQTHVICVT